MTPLVEELDVDDVLRKRLVRVGHAIETAPIFDPRASHAPDSSTGGWIRGTLIALVAGSVLGGTLYFGRPPANDPVVGVIPKGITVDQIEVIAPSESSPGNGVRSTTLLTVDGIDALLMSYAGKPEPASENDGERIAFGIRVRTTVMNDPAINSRTLARWRLPNAKNYSAILAVGNVKLERSIDRLVAFSMGSARTERNRKVRVVASWNDPVGTTGSFMSIAGDAPRTVSSQVSSIPAQLLARVDTITGRPSAGRFRYGDFVVGVEPVGLTARNLRPIRRSELSTLMKQIDRRIAAKIPAAEWVRLNNGFDVGFHSEWRCVRSPSDVSCGPFLFSRLVDDTWVRVSFRGVETIRVDGSVIVGENFDDPSAKGPNVSVFILPKDAEVAELRSGPPNSPFTYELLRPEW